MRKSYYVMHKLLRYAENVLRYAVIITLCGNYYVMRRHTRPPSKYDVRLNNIAYNSIQFNNGIGKSVLEMREVCCDSTQLDISYATFYGGHLPRYVRYDIW